MDMHACDVVRAGTEIRTGAKLSIPMRSFVSLCVWHLAEANGDEILEEGEPPRKKIAKMGEKRQVDDVPIWMSKMSDDLLVSSCVYLIGLLVGQ